MKRVPKLGHVIALAVAALVLVPLLVAGLSLWTLLNPGLERQQLQSQAALARSVASQIEFFLREGVNEIRLFAEILEDRQVEISYQQVQRFVDLTELFEVVYLVDGAGIVKLAGVPSDSDIRVDNLAQLDISRMAYFKQLETDSAEQWSDAFLSSASGELAVAYAMELERSEAYQYLIGELSIHSLPQLLQRIQASSEQTVMILDAADQLIGHPVESLSRQQMNLQTLPILQAEVSEFGRIGQFSFQETDYYGSLIQMPDPQWKIIVAMPVSDFWNLLVVVFRSLLIVFVLSLVIVFSLSRKLSAQLTTGFSTYSQVVQQLAQGRYPIEPPQVAIAELKQLSNDLTRTGQAIQQREVQLEEINADLERRIEARTQDLQSANDDLTRTLTQLKQAQNELVENGKLAALGSLVAGVSHELNTPIGVSVTASSSVLDDAKSLRRKMEQGQLSKTDFEDSISHIINGSELIDRNLSRATELIASFKQVAVDQSSDLRRQFLLEEVIHDVISTLQPKYKKRNFEFRVHSEDHVNMDSYPGSLIQVLTNLIDNAVFHGYHGQNEGVVTVNARRLTDQQAEIVVEDFGAGIAQPDLHRVFEPFYTTKLGQGGSGLGLNIVHAIVQKVLGGRIAVTSRVDKGTRFTLVLPMRAPIKVATKDSLLDAQR